MQILHNAYKLNTECKNNSDGFLCVVFGVWVEPKDGARVALFPGAEEGKQKEHLVHTVSTCS